VDWERDVWNYSKVILSWDERYQLLFSLLILVLTPSSSTSLPPLPNKVTLPEQEDKVV